MLKFVLLNLLFIGVFCADFDRPWMKEIQEKPKYPSDNIIVNLRRQNSRKLDCPLNETAGELKFAQWFKKGEDGIEKELIFEDGRFDFPTLTSVLIQNLSPSDEGMYYCKLPIVNIVVKGFRLVIIDFSDTTPPTKFVEAPVWKIVPPSHQTFDNSRFFVIPCKAQGTDVVVTAYRLKDDGTVFKVYTNGAVIVHRPSIEDTGSYKCVAENSAGRIEYIYSITVKVNGGLSEWMEYGPCDKDCGWGFKTRRRECNNPEPAGGGRYCTGKMTERSTCWARSCQEPQLRKFGFEITDDSLVLDCKAKGIPTPTVIWRFNGNRFPETYDYKNTHFVIPEARARSGSYSCTVSNSVGYFSMYITIQLNN